jgi:hypothetical protein
MALPAFHHTANVHSDITGATFKIRNLHPSPWKGDCSEHQFAEDFLMHSVTFQGANYFLSFHSLPCPLTYWTRPHSSHPWFYSKHKFIHVYIYRHRNSPTLHASILKIEAACIYIYIYIYTHTHTHTQKLTHLTCFNPKD